MLTTRRLTTAAATMAAVALLGAPAVSAQPDGRVGAAAQNTDERPAAQSRALPGAQAAGVVPKACSAFATYLYDTGHFGVMYLEDGEIGYWAPTKETGRFGYIPRASVASSEQGNTLRGYSVAPGGTLQRWTRVFYANDTLRTYRETIGTGWTDTRALAATNQYLYALRGDELHRYTIGSNHRLSGKVVAATGLSNLQTLSFAQRTPSADTLIATSRGGSLQMIKVSYRNPTSRNVTVLQRTGFGQRTAASAGSCGGGSTALLSVSESGRVYAHRDADGWNSSTHGLKGGLASPYLQPYYVYSN